LQLFIISGDMLFDRADGMIRLLAGLREKQQKDLVPEREKRSLIYPGIQEQVHYSAPIMAFQ
jgi:hypothetical protein